MKSLLPKRDKRQIRNFPETRTKMQPSGPYIDQSTFFRPKCDTSLSILDHKLAFRSKFIYLFDLKKVHSAEEAIGTEDTIQLVVFIPCTEH